MTTWVRWRWQHGFTFQPYTKYHALREDGRKTLCGRDGRHNADPPWGNTRDDPSDAQRCRQCTAALAIAVRQEGGRA